ncbi:energy transducer TonB [Gracilimonas mengyeensis]|uniref:Outer membrane transport energization protein TonB n=1 Tax=Gracilimonas mengyeensis TaxID=1302730 RepID=A0A521B7C6_9BACT|nr:energy transducer TonB [Gracilimonas mengyeensis]SMO43017.1 outer membrane transport energization protein TonB [Gracilimonas mengyeensis]
MINERKSPKADLKKSYTVYLEAGLILALLVMILAVKVNIEDEPPQVVELDEQEVVEMEEVVQTKQIETPPPPPRPPVPVEVPNDEIIEDEIIDLDAELDMNQQMDLPPPPPEEEEEEDFFVVVEQMPKLIGGMAKLQGSVSYPEMARRAGIEGRVTVQFIVNEQGNVENARVVRGIGGGCDEEALKAVKQAEFEPGMQRGRPVRVQYALSINFRLEN